MKNSEKMKKEKGQIKSERKKVPEQKVTGRKYMKEKER